MEGDRNSLYMPWARERDTHSRRREKNDRVERINAKFKKRKKKGRMDNQEGLGAQKEPSSKGVSITDLPTGREREGGQK